MQNGKIVKWQNSLSYHFASSPLHQFNYLLVFEAAEGISERLKVVYYPAVATVEVQKPAVGGIPLRTAIVAGV